MSAKYEKKNGFVVAPLQINGFEEAMITSMFDEQVDYDIQEINKKIKETKLLKRLCLVKILLFPPQYLLSRLLLGKLLTEDTLIATKIYWKYLRNKMDTEEFKKELAKSLAEAKSRI